MQTFELGFVKAINKASDIFEIESSIFETFDGVQIVVIIGDLSNEIYIPNLSSQAIKQYFDDNFIPTSLNHSYSESSSLSKAFNLRINLTDNNNEWKLPDGFTRLCNHKFIFYGCVTCFGTYQQPYTEWPSYRFHLSLPTTFKMSTISQRIADAISVYPCYIRPAGYFIKEMEHSEDATITPLHDDTCLSDLLSDNLTLVFLNTNPFGRPVHDRQQNENDVLHIYLEIGSLKGIQCHDFKNTFFFK
jgi:hypothetical protein